MIDNPITNTAHDEIFYTDTNSTYDSQRALRHRRETNFILTDAAVTQQKKYEIGGMQYLVRSIFPCDSKRTADDNIRHLINGEIDKVS